MMLRSLNKFESNKSIYPVLAQNLLVNYRDIFQDDLKEQELAEISFLQEKLKKQAIAIALFGMVSRGKTSLLNALFGKKLGETGAINGVTQGISTYEWKISQRSSIHNEENQKLELQFIDTQGLDEVGGEIGGMVALEAAKRADLILFVIAGDMTRLEQESITQLQTFYKPILLVFNKADLYPESDREAIYKALQNEEMRKLISPQEIVLTVAEPLPVKVRLQYSDGRESQEVWERPQPDVQALKERIVSLLNTEGKALLVINVLRALLEIQDAVTQRHLQKLQTSTAIAAVIFVSEAIALLISPHLWLDGLISGTFNSLFVLWAIGKYASQKKYLWLLLIVAIACLSGGLGIHIEAARYLQILWAGLSISVLLKGIITDINHSRGSGKLGAKALMAEIIQSVPDGSILRRFH
jgi:small GTP-binding protein